MSWLTVFPNSEHGFELHKGAFHDAIHLLHGWKLSSLPSLCVCGKSFTVDHAPYGAFPTACHNEIRDIVDVFTEVCSGVGIEPVLQALSGELLRYHTSNSEENAHLDIVARGVWDCTQQNTFLD